MIPKRPFAWSHRPGLTALALGCFACALAAFSTTEGQRISDEGPERAARSPKKQPPRSFSNSSNSQPNCNKARVSGASRSKKGAADAGDAPPTGPSISSRPENRARRRPGHGTGLRAKLDRPLQPAESQRFALAVDDYQFDDGVAENAIGTGAQGTVIIAYAWYDIIVGKEIIETVNVEAGFAPGDCDGIAVTVAVLDDPDGDGDPFDAQIIERGSGTLGPAGSPWNTAKILLDAPVDLEATLTNLDGRFIIAFEVTQDVPSGCDFPATVDQTTPVNQRSFLGLDPLGLDSCPNQGGGGGAGCTIDCVMENCCAGCAGDLLLRAGSQPAVCGDGTCVPSAEGCTCQIGNPDCGGAGEPTCDCPADASESGLTECTDGIDNDCDGNIDCDDAGCAAVPDCADCVVDCGTPSEGGQALACPGGTGNAEPVCTATGQDPDNFNSGCNSNAGTVYSCDLTVNGPVVCGTSGRYTENCLVDADCPDGATCNAGPGNPAACPGTTPSSCVCRLACTLPGGAECGGEGAAAGTCEDEATDRCTGGETPVRDTDWFLFEIPPGPSKSIELRVIAGFGALVGFLDDAGGANCAAAAFIAVGPPYVNPAVTEQCTQATGQIVTIATACLVPGLYTAFVAPRSGDLEVTCGTEYSAELNDLNDDHCGDGCLSQRRGRGAQLATSCICDPSITGDGDLACQTPDQLGHGIPPDDGLVALTSTAPLAVADTFAALTPGGINRVCWWGTYVDFSGTPAPCTEVDFATDDFTVTYYNNDAATVLPGTVIATFRGAGFTVTRGVTTLLIGSGAGNLIEVAYTGTHALVNINDTNCRWLEVQNTLADGECTWLWETAGGGDNTAAQDTEGDGYTPGLGDEGDHVLSDLAWCLGRVGAGTEIVVAPGACQLSGGCCDDLNGACLNDQTFSDCLSTGGRFGLDQDCPLDSPCGGAACCHSNGTCDNVADASECISPGDNFLPGTFCGQAICNPANSCIFDNGPGDPSGGAPGSQLALSNPVDPTNDFVAEAADNFEFKGTAGNCTLTSITWWVTHFGQAGGGCTGNPNCEDTPDDYTAINVVIYNDAFVEGGPPDVLTVDCNSIALPDGVTGGAPFACTPVAGEAAACGAAATTQCLDNDGDGTTECAAQCNIVSDLAGTVVDLDVELTVAHTWQGDIVASVQRDVVGGGPRALLIDRPGSHAAGPGGDGYSADNFGDPAVAAARLLLDDQSGGPQINIYNGGGAGIANYIGPAASNGGDNPQAQLGIFNGEPRNGTWTLFVSDHFGVSDDGSLEEFALIFSNTTPKGPTGAPVSTTDPVPCATAQDCVDAGCGDTSTCVGNDCMVGGETCDFVTPTGGHSGVVKNDIDVTSFTWTPYEKPPGTPVPDSYEISMTVNIPVQKNKKNWLALVPVVPFNGFYQTGWMTSQNSDGNSAQQIFEAAGLFPWAPVGDDLSFLLNQCSCDGPCTSLATCADQNNDGKRDDACLWYECVASVCLSTPRGFLNGGQFGQADMGSPSGPNQCDVDGVGDASDVFHALRCFSNQNFTGGTGYPCEDNAPPPPQVPQAYNVDAGSNASCVLDGVCDGNDAFHALRSFSNTNFMGGPGYPCACNGPAPSHADSVEPSEWTGLTLKAPRAARPGDLVDVDVYLDDDLKALTGYQLHLGTGGGSSAPLELVDISVDTQRGDYVYSGVAGTWCAFNRSIGQMVVGMNTLEGASARAGSYLATFTYRVPKDAAGTYVVEVLHGPSASPTENRTFLFGYSSGPVGLRAAPPVSVEVRGPR
jgi:hypothetical protein